MRIENQDRIYNPFKVKIGKDFNKQEHLKYILSILNIIPSKVKKPTRLIKRNYRVVIMAAGKGTRMDINIPKSLYKLEYPIGRNSFLDNILSVLGIIRNNISGIDIVVRESSIKYFKAYAKENKTIKLIGLPTSSIKGTANCLMEYAKHLNSEKDIILLWGDIACIPIKYIFLSLLIHEKYDSLITLPSRYIENPYVAFVRDIEGNFTKVYHSNENEHFNGWAEQDSMCFILNKRIFKLLDRFLISEKKREESKEIDFVHFIPYCASAVRKSVIGLPVCEDEYVMGVNTISKANKINEYFSAMSEDEYKNIFYNLLFI